MSPSGIILVDKPSGISSAKAIAQIKKSLAIKKIGHAGTLDPMATGLLVVLVGKATKLARFAEGGRKIYSGSILFGLVTDSDDISGQVLHSSDKLPKDDELRKAIKNFQGKIRQRPPAISAIKVDGKRAYKLARQGQPQILAERSVDIYKFELGHILEAKSTFTLECSKGTYVRSLARDLGQFLDCGGCLNSLRREFSAPFSVASAKSPDKIALSDILDWSILFPDTPRVKLDQPEVLRISQGNMINAKEVFRDYKNCEYVIYEDQNNVALGILEQTDQNWRILVNLA